ncbi:RN213 ligase, partial [Bucco capensis]|nr:RN213 ligase [Bucco capensis]
YQYLSRYQCKVDLDSFTFTPGSIQGTEKECLECLMDFCQGRKPSWTELSNFTRFLSFQLQKCEHSAFCSPVALKELRGF